MDDGERNDRLKISLGEGQTELEPMGLNCQLRYLLPPPRAPGVSRAEVHGVRKG